jgi:deoxyribodipyrimidine photo-lyase
MAGIHIVWFKRDLRVRDHAPLASAAERGTVLPLFIAEPRLWQQPDYAGRHWAFVAECLAELRAQLAALGQPLVVRIGEAENVLTKIADELPIKAVWSHEETGNGWTYERDRKVRGLLDARQIPWHELPHNGVVRCLESRDQWTRIWEQRMRAPLKLPPHLGPIRGLDQGTIPTAAELRLPSDPCPNRQRGGRARGTRILEEFLAARGSGYNQAMSSPNTAFDGCSRLSPHLAWGTLSMREVVQATRLRRDRVRAMPPGQRGGWSAALAAFEGRLHWHCHFIQKLESEPRIEFENLHRACDGLREDHFDAERFEAWKAGQTGFPLVDACMRALQAGGWMNFRMRAMLVSFGSYQLWLHWRQPALALARLFTDYEPGIHYSQVQMQSGTTGINTLRIYNPVKQSNDQDPAGIFIRRWVPELAAIPAEWIHSPWLTPPHVQHRNGCVIGKHYPSPIVEHLSAAREARMRIGAARRTRESRAEGRQIQDKHGSRRGGRSAARERVRANVRKETAR